MRRTTNSFLIKTFLCVIIVTVFSVSTAFAALEPPTVSFAVMSDIHIHENNIDVHNKLVRALDDYWRFNPQMDLIVINGDLTNGFPAHYDKLRQLLDSVPHPSIHFTPGNHDFYKMLYNQEGQQDFEHLPNGWSSEQAMDLFQSFTGYDKPYHDTWVNGYHFIFLATEKSRDFNRSIGKNGYISTSQLNWLEEKLNEGTEKGGKPTFVFFHHPLPNTLNGSQYDVNIVQHRALRNILNQHPEVIFFSGHTHYSLRKTDQKYTNRFLMVGSSSIMRSEESVYVEVYDDYVDIHSRDHRRGEWMMDQFYRHSSEQAE